VKLTSLDRFILWCVTALVALAVATLASPLLPWAKWYTDPLLAAWVQSIGSIFAIVAAFAIGNHQARVQINLTRIAAANEDIQAAETIFYLAGAALSTVQFVRGGLDHRDKVVNAAMGGFNSLHREIEAFEVILSDVPTYRVNPKILRCALVVAGNVRQFRLKVRMALEHHRSMDAAAFADFFATMQSVEWSLSENAADAKKLCVEFHRVARQLDGD
jgi:hypothetical protein